MFQCAVFCKMSSLDVFFFFSGIGGVLRVRGSRRRSASRLFAELAVWVPANIRAALLKQLPHPTISAKTAAGQTPSTRTCAWRMQKCHKKGFAPQIIGSFQARRTVSNRHRTSVARLWSSSGRSQDWDCKSSRATEREDGDGKEEAPAGDKGQFSKQSFSCPDDKMLSEAVLCSVAGFFLFHMVQWSSNFRFEIFGINVTSLLSLINRWILSWAFSKYLLVLLIFFVYF